MSLSLNQKHIKKLLSHHPALIAKLVGTTYHGNENLYTQKSIKETIEQGNPREFPEEFYVCFETQEMCDTVWFSFDKDKLQDDVFEREPKEIELKFRSTNNPVVLYMNCVAWGIPYPV